MNTHRCYYSTAQLTWLMLLRLFIGWHFMFEGIAKIVNPAWSAKAYLMDSQGFAADFFLNMAQNASLLPVIDFLNMWALFLIGLGLTLGIFGRLSSIGGILLLVMYTFSHPSFMGANYMMPFEGTYLWIDKNIVELAALGVLFVFPTSQIIGLDRWVGRLCPALVKYKLV